MQNIVRLKFGCKGDWEVAFQPCQAVGLLSSLPLFACSHLALARRDQEPVRDGVSRSAGTGQIGWPARGCCSYHHVICPAEPARPTTFAFLHQNDCRILSTMVTDCTTQTSEYFLSVLTYGNVTHKNADRNILSLQQRKGLWVLSLPCQACPQLSANVVGCPSI